MVERPPRIQGQAREFEGRFAPLYLYRRNEYDAAREIILVECGLRNPPEVEVEVEEKKKSKIERFVSWFTFFLQ